MSVSRVALVALVLAAAACRHGAPTAGAPPRAPEPAEAPASVSAPPEVGPAPVPEPAPPLPAAQALLSWMLGPFVRAAANPILGPDRAATFECPVRGAAVRWQEKDVVNPAAVVRDGKVHLLFRAEDTVGRFAGTSRIGLATSEDGVSFTRRAEPVLYPEIDFMQPYEWEGGCEDPRVVEREDGTYVMTYTAFDGAVARLAIATSRDLVHWTKHGLAFGQAGGGKWKDLSSKSGAILARLDPRGRLVAARIRGKYWMYWGEPEVFAATSDDAVAWTPVERDDVPAAGRSFAVVIGARHGRFDSGRVEPGPPALLTERGILLLYNGANARAHGEPSLPDGASAGGQLLLDPLDPTSVLARGTDPFFRPQPTLEAEGHAPFLQGLVFFHGRWLLYYGMADSTIGVAEHRP